MNKARECLEKMLAIADEYGYAVIAGVGKIGEDDKPQVLSGAGGDYEVLHKLIDDVTWHINAHKMGLEEGE